MLTVCHFSIKIVWGLVVKLPLWISKVQWSNGYDFCLTHRRFPVRSWVEPLFAPGALSSTCSMIHIQSIQVRNLTNGRQRPSLTGVQSLQSQHLRTEPGPNSACTSAIPFTLVIATPVVGLLSSDFPSNRTLDITYSVKAQASCHGHSLNATHLWKRRGWRCYGRQRIGRRQTTIFG